MAPCEVQSLSSQIIVWATELQNSKTDTWKSHGILKFVFTCYQILQPTLNKWAQNPALGHLGQNLWYNSDRMNWMSEKDQSLKPFNPHLGL